MSLVGSEADDWMHFQKALQAHEQRRAAERPARTNGYRRQRRRKGWAAFPSRREAHERIRIAWLVEVTFGFKPGSVRMGPPCGSGEREILDGGGEGEG